MSQTEELDQIDVFAAIAAESSPRRKDKLYEPQPPHLPQLFLPAETSQSGAEFRPRPSLAIAEELEKLRVRYKKFEADLAPALKSPRLRQTLDHFQWRLEGTEVWEQVTIPHYGGPIGRAVAEYRTTFQVTREMLAVGALFIRFKGVDYKAHVLVNGRHVGSHEGFFAPFEFDITEIVREGVNELLVRVENDAIPPSNRSWGEPIEGDKIYAATGPGWDDPKIGWSHCPPGMGIYQDVSIEARPRLHVRDIFVRPVPQEHRAEAWIEVYNCDVQPQDLNFTLSVFGQNFRQTVFADKVFKAISPAGPRVNLYRFNLSIPQARLWDLDTPWLYQVQVTLPNGDTAARQFGMRSFRMDTEHKPYGQLYLNDRRIKLRGANTMGFEQQDVFKRDWDQLRDDILLAKLCNMNFWRITQRPVQSEVYEMCDKLGLMTQTDLPLFGYLPRSQFLEAVRQANEMERLVRPHPCNVLISYINEPFANASKEKSNRQCTRAELEQFFEAANIAVRLANPDRVIKPVDGDYDPPAPGLPDNHCYNGWYNGHGLDIGKLHKGYWQRVKPDWLYGCGEFGSEGLDPVNVMRRHYPKSWLPQAADEEAGWSPNQINGAQTGNFHYLWFQTPCTLEGWVAASQSHQAWITRLMTEAFRRDNRMTSCAIHLFIDAFPAGWMKTIMDVDRQPKPAYFAYRDALTPLMANIRTDRYTFFAGEPMQFEFWVCNDTNDDPSNLELRYQLERDHQSVFAQCVPAKIDAMRSTFQGFFKIDAPRTSIRSELMLRVALARMDGTILHDTSVEVEVWPRLPPGQAASIFAMDEAAFGLVKELNLPQVRSIHEARIIVASNLRQQAAMDAEVKRGATAVVLELSEGKYTVAETPIEIEPCGMSPVHFASCGTGHPIVAGFQSDDFKFWYNPKEDRPSPLLATTMTAEGWTPILTTGRGSWGKSWEPALAVAERPYGNGRYRIAQINLAGRTATNPAAQWFAYRLLDAMPVCDAS